jgi:myo-inositol-1(or 4)-monophosphatase
LLGVAERAVGDAAELLRTRSPERLRLKGDRDPASDVDLAIERSVRAYLRERTPDIGFLGEEEGGGVPAAGPCWVLDPIDGTVNFLHSYPLCAIALVLIDGGASQAAVIDLPLLGLRYTAVADGGAYAGARRLRGSTTGSLREALVSIDQYTFGPDAERVNGRRHELVAALAERVQRVRMIGASTIDLAWTAEGRLDACVMLGNKPWDTAAGVLVAREAGVRVLDLDGADHSLVSSGVVAVTAGLETELMAVVSGR